MALNPLYKVLLFSHRELRCIRP